MKKKYTHLTIYDRQTIEIQLKRWETQKDISKVLKRSESSISREITRNWIKKKWSNKKEYLAYEAQIKSYQRRWKAKTQSMKINLNNEMKAFIINEIQRNDIETSPKSIAKLWNDTQKEKKNRISHTSIYNWLETSRWDRFKEFLLFKYKWYRKKKRIKWPRIKWRINIENRTIENELRLEQWHFEADLIVSKKGFKWALLTLIDRKTRLPQIFKLKDKSSKNIMNLIKSVKNDIWIKSITFDNWLEFAFHEMLNDVWIDTYFSDPYSPWQKGSIENFNRMVRRFFPKWTIFDYISEKKIKSVCSILANTPREILGYLSPYQVHFQ